MGSQGPGRKRIPNRNGLTAEEDALNIIAKEAEARLAAKRAARAEAREIRMKELERQQKEIYQVQKKYYGLDNLDNKWGDIEQWMENNERYTRHSQRHGSVSDDEEQISVRIRSSLRSNGYDDYSTISSQGSLYEDSFYSSSWRSSTQAVRNQSEYSGVLGLSSRTSSSSVCASALLDDTDRDVVEKGPSQASTSFTATLASLGSCRGSGDSTVTADPETSMQEIKEIHELKDQIQDVEAKYMQSLKDVKDSLVEMEEKYRKAMVSNAQLDNEKTNLMYQVDTLKDSLMELEEFLGETRRESAEKSKHLEREKHAYSILHFQFNELKETLKQSEELLSEIRQLQLKQDGFIREISDLQETIDWKNKKIGALERQKEYSDAIRNERDELRDEVVQLKDILKKHGIVFGPDISINQEAGAHAAVPQGSTVLEIRLRKLVDERENLVEQVKRLKEQIGQGEKLLDQHFQVDGSKPEGEVIENGTDAAIVEYGNVNRQISDLKFKLVRSEQEATALEQNVIRLEGQVMRYKSSAENAEKVEDELKTEKRKLQRELRAAMDKIEELETSNNHLTKRLEKMRANRGMTASP
ncbi:leucine-rich repeat flightless-interacting protein 2 isoform X17 [Brachyhypopomus gauderio]|uniref:leucine-rich repeat flightless-interacting protein 2 isoform X17 n=1 Tax=Brachyhypopomus gauderio TaxID=698409 RepID=UPI0040424924